MKRLLPIFLIIVANTVGFAQPVFNALNGPTGGNFRIIEKTSANKLFAMTDRFIYESVNNGNSWTKNSLNLQNDGPVGLYIDNTDKIYVATKQRIHKSTDGGATWTTITPTGVWNPAKNLKKNHTTGSLYIIGYNGTFYGIQKSSDDGATWFDVSPESNQINQIEVNNFSTSVLVAAANSSNFYRLVNDVTWESVASPGGISFQYEPGLVVNKTNGKLYSVSSSGARESLNNGVSWSVVTNGSTIPFGDPNQRHGIFSSESSNRIYIHLNSNLYYKDTPVTTSSAWTQATLGNSDPIGTLLAFSTNVFAGLRNDFRNAEGILRSTNGAVNWSYADSGIFEYESTSMMRADNGRLIVLNGGGSINRSTDDGTTWTKTKLCDCGFQTIIKRSNGNLVVIGDRTYLSTDNGASWNPLGTPHADYLNGLVSGDGGATVYGIGGFGSVKIYKSTNGGQSFSDLGISISGTPEFYSLAADNANNLYAAAGNNKVYKLPAPNNNAPAEITGLGISFFRGVKTVGPNVYVFGDATGGGTRLAKSVNQGTNWTFQAIDESDEIVMVSDNIIISRNFDNEISFSNDAGVAWNVAYATGSTFAVRLSNALIDENGIAYVSTSGAPMYKSAASIVRPNKPTNLKAIGIADNVVRLEWDYSTAGAAFVDAFIIERKLTSGGTFEVIGDADGSELYFRDGTTVKNTSYDYRVIADSDAGSNTSDPISLTTKDDCGANIPDNRSWSGVANPGGFPNPSILIKKLSSDYYEISDVTAGSLVGVPAVGGGPAYSSATVSTIFNAACGTPFIEDKNDVFPNGNGTFNGSNTITLNFQIDKARFADTEKTITLTLNAVDPAPEVPENVSAYVVSDTQIQLQWTGGDYQQSYVIERSLTTITGFSQVGTVNYPALTFTDSGPFTNGTTYFYRVKARNFGALLESAYSPEVSVVFNSPIFVLSNTVVSSTAASVPTMAWGDLDNDGFEDLVMAKLNFFGQTAEEPLLFRNNGSANFQLLTGKFPTALNFVGPTIADYNNDGNLDIFISGFGIDGAGNTTRNYLLRNNGDLTFTDLDTSPVVVIEPGQSAISASWVDVNANGFIDLFVPYEDGAGQKLFAGSAGGTFTENTGAGALITDSFSKGTAVWADYDNDGDMDVFVVSGSDTNPNRLYNNNSGTFTRVTPSAFDGDLGNFFSASWGDYDNDQDLDLFVANQSGKNLLYRNNGNGTFAKVAELANSPSENVVVNNTGSAWGDIDNDGDLDLLVTSTVDLEDDEFYQNLLYINSGNGTFTKKTNELISAFNISFNLGAAFADYDNDGHLDVVIGALNFPIGGESGVLGDPSPIRLYRNNVSTGNWIKIKLNGAGGPNASVSNRSAIGARIRIVAGGKTQIREITSLSGTGAQSSLIAHFGLGADATITSIDVRFPSGSQKTLNNISANQLLEIDEDSEGPIISPFTPQNVDKGFGQLAVSIVASDAVATSEVRVLRRAIGGSEFMIEPMTRETGTNNWQITALESWYDDMGLEFYFEAEDPFGNVSRSPAAGNYYSYMNYKETNAPKFPSGSLVFGGTDRTWNIISIPFDLGNAATVTSVIEELGAADETAWRLLTYQNQTEWAEFPSSFSSFVRGKGYFLNVKTPPSQGITIADPLLAPQNNQANLFTIGLNQGWNQIGNPYLVPISWSDIKAFNNVAGVGDLKIYNSNGRTYNDGDVLSAYQGGFVFANEAVQNYLISFDGQTAGGRKASSGRIASTELDNENWRTMFTLKQSDVEFTLGGIGMSPDAKLSYDDFDDVTVPRLNDFLEMNFHHPEHFAKRFSRDVVPTQGEFTWEFTVDSNLKGIATLQWDNEAFGLNEKELYLFDMAQQKPIDMRETNSYSFDAAQSNRFKVYFGANLKNRIQPERIMLGQAFPNPANAVTTIPFTLPESTGMYQVRLDVYDMMGRRVETLHDGQLPAGFYESTWDTTNGQITNGLYTYRLAVAGDGKKEVFSNKIILNK